jgi:hypothetical protein
MYIGGFSDYWWPFTGDVQDLNIYSKALTHSEVLDLPMPVCTGGQVLQNGVCVTPTTTSCVPSDKWTGINRTCLIVKNTFGNFEIGRQKELTDIWGGYRANVVNVPASSWPKEVTVVYGWKSASPFPYTEKIDPTYKCYSSEEDLVMFRKPMTDGQLLGSNLSNNINIESCKVFIVEVRLGEGETGSSFIKFIKLND